jgi:glycosyltransferase involved in cell wall biosynthesis
MKVFSISIIIPTYNRACLIRETLDSIKAQTSPHWECIVVDDGSSDDTEAIVAEYSEGDSRFSFYLRDREPKGAPTCRNIGLQHSKGEWVIFLDSDDLLNSKLIENIIGINQQLYDNVDAIIYRTDVFEKNIDLSESCYTPDSIQDDLNSYLIGNIVWQTSGAVWRKNFVKLIGGFREGLIKGQDWDLAVKALLNNAKLLKIPKLGTYHRIGSYAKIGSVANSCEVHYQFFESCVELIIVARKMKNKHASNALYASALYRLGCLIWFNVKMPDKTLIKKLTRAQQLNYLYRITIFGRLYFVFLFLKIILIEKQFAEYLLAVDGMPRRLFFQSHS